MNLSILNLLVVSLMWWQIDLPVPPVETETKTVKLSVEADWRYEKDKEVIFIKGQTNLAPGTFLTVRIKGGIRMPLDSDKVELLDLARVAVDNDGAWMTSSDSLKTNFAPEYYEILVAIASGQSRNQDFPPEKLDQAKGYYLLQIFSPRLIERRQKSIGQLMKMVNEAYQLDSQLRKKVTELEDVKKGKTPTRILIDGAFVITKTKETLLSELGEKWLTWETLWLEQLGKLIARVKEEKVCLMSAETIYDFLHKANGNYRYYRRQAFNDQGKLVQTPIDPGMSQTNLAGIKQNHAKTIEDELAYKIIHDDIICLEQLIRAFEKIKDQQQTTSQFIGVKQATVDYLFGTKAELADYTKHGLFLEKSRDDSKPKDIYNRLLALIDLTTTLANKFSRRLVAPNNMELKSGCQELISLINQKAENMLRDIR